MNYIRTNIYISKSQKDGLKKLGEEKSIKPAELVRRAIEEYLEREGI